MYTVTTTGYITPRHSDLLTGSKVFVNNQYQRSVDSHVTLTITSKFHLDGARDGSSNIVA